MRKLNEKGKAFVQGGALTLLVVFTSMFVFADGDDVEHPNLVDISETPTTITEEAHTGDLYMAQVLFYEDFAVIRTVQGDVVVELTPTQQVLENEPMLSGLMDKQALNMEDFVKAVESVKH